MTTLEHTGPATGLTATSTTSGCGCGCGGSSPGGSALVSLERTRFFARQLVGPDDLTQDQTYFREKERRHNRLLHGWGIVCGARVMEGAAPCEVVVEPGYVLGPYGDEIVIDSEVTIDVCKQDPTGAAFDPCGGVDPWCAEVRPQRRAGATLYLAVRYSECDTRPTRVTGCGCGCDEAECEYTRTRDSYELKVLDALPDSYLPSHIRIPMSSGEALQEGAMKTLSGVSVLAEVRQLMSAFSCTGGARACPPCPTSPWVILSDLTIDAAGKVAVDCAPHRRYVVSFADYSFTCDSKSSGVYGPVSYGAQRAMLVDSTDLASGPAPAQPPAATVAARSADGQWLEVQGRFDVTPGETIGNLLSREGGRTLVDLRTGDTATLREVYAAAGADPATKVDSVAGALAPLEGAKIDTAGLRIVRAAYDGLIDRHGLAHLDAAHAGSPAAAAQLPAQSLRTVEDASAVGKHVAAKTVAEVAATTKDTFVAAATKGLKGPVLKSEKARAEQVWSEAARVVKLSSAWGT